MDKKLQKSVLFVGDVMRDIIVKPEGDLRIGSDRAAEIAMKHGGAAANQAVWLAATGQKVKLVARIGENGAPELVKRFKDKNIETVFTIDKSRETGMLVAIVTKDGERSFYTDRGANMALNIADVPKDILDDVGLIMLSGYSFFADGPRDVVGQIMSWAKQKNIKVAIDPASAGFIKDAGVNQFLDWIKGAAILLLNLEEAELLSGEKSLARQLAVLSELFDLVIIKKGAKGASALQKNGTMIEVEAPYVKIVDSTGAGDAFAAGFIRAYLGKNSLVKCLEAGVVNGSMAVTQMGSQPE
ncbi:MAG: PfkB family carbohydrate kinase [Devosiaceae bacterium]|nr:PfkB family carbohydrate kinase [Devosiaceae bacterium]